MASTQARIAADYIAHLIDRLAEAEDMNAALTAHIAQQQPEQPDTGEEAAK